MASPVDVSLVDVSLVDINMPDNRRYLGLKVSSTCTVAEWKRSLEDGSLTGSKVLWASKLRCRRKGKAGEVLEDTATLPARPEPLFLTGPDSVLTMLDLTLQRTLGRAIPLGRGLRCASANCTFLVHRSPQLASYCCISCSHGSQHHDRDCECIVAPGDIPRADAALKPITPPEGPDSKGKYKNRSLSHEDLRKNDGDWQQPTASQKKQVAEYIQRANRFDGLYMDYERTSVAAYTKKFTSGAYGWSLDHSPDLLCELLYEGFATMGVEIVKDGLAIQVLLICREPKVNIWMFQDTHISRQVRKRAKRFTMTIDHAFDDVLLGCVRMHGETWLFRGWRWMIRNLHVNGYQGSRDIHVKVHSFELWDKDGQLVAGDIGCVVGGIYTSMTGFHERHTKNAGEVQLVLTASLLHKMGYDWIDLGQALKYKECLGAKLVNRKEYIERLQEVRDRSCASLAAARFDGQDLLRHMQGVVALRDRVAAPQGGDDEEAPEGPADPFEKQPAASQEEETEARKKREKKEAAAKQKAAADQAAQLARAEREMDRRAEEAKQVREEEKARRERVEAEEREAEMVSQSLEGGREGVGDGRIWVVVGGKDKGGILVRRSLSTASQVLAARLGVGAKLEALGMAGSRMHYRKVSGDGPDWGWVSVELKDKALVLLTSEKVSDLEDLEL